MCQECIYGLTKWKTATIFISDTAREGGMMLYQQVIKDIRHNATDILREIKDPTTDTQDALFYAKSLLGHAKRLVDALESEPENQR